MITNRWGGNACIAHNSLAHSSNHFQEPREEVFEVTAREATIFCDLLAMRQTVRRAERSSGPMTVNEAHNFLGSRSLPLYQKKTFECVWHACRHAG